MTAPNAFRGWVLPATGGPGTSPWTTTLGIIHPVTIANPVVVGASIVVGGEQMRVVGQLRVESDIDIADAGGTAAFLNFGAGSTAPVSALGNARMRFNEGLARYEQSIAGGGYVPFGGGGGTAIFSGTAGEAIAAGAPVSMNNALGFPRLFEGDASSGTAKRPKIVGVTVAAILAGATGDVVVAGEVAVPDAQWDVVPLVANVGDDVFLSETQGNLTLTAPLSGTGATSLRIGHVSVGGAGAVNIVVDIGEPALLA